MEWLPAPPEDETVPKWVDPGIQNKRHLVKPTGAHFLVPVQVGTGVIDAVLDTGGARSVIDVGTARELGLRVERATARKNFGSFWGPSSKPVNYYGRVRGPITIKFSENITITLKELKVVSHGEALLILGTDFLVWGDQPWQFGAIGMKEGRAYLAL